MENTRDDRHGCGRKFPPMIATATRRIAQLQAWNDGQRVRSPAAATKFRWLAANIARLVLSCERTYPLESTSRVYESKASGGRPANPAGSKLN